MKCLWQVFSEAPIMILKINKCWKQSACSCQNNKLEIGVQWKSINNLMRETQILKIT